jgi:flavin reductase (DIM6/NTAB) family NADH-FMN oxidoreductase RutF
MPDISPLARALGRVPSGLFIVTANAATGPIGFLGSFVMQTGFEPPTLVVAVGKGRPHLDAIRAAGRFGVSVLDKQSSPLMGAFLKARPDGGTPFDDVASTTTARGAVVLEGALAWLDCRLVGEHETGDHVVVFGVVEDGATLRDGEPTTHVRRNGLSY